MKKLETYEIMPIFPQQPVSDTQISPDGSNVLLTYTTTNMNEDKYDTQVWLMSLQEKIPRPFTSGKSDNLFPRWSPSGQKVLFLSNRAGVGEMGKNDTPRKMQLCVISFTGGEAKKLTSMEEGVARPFWSQDEKTIFFFSSLFKGERAEDSDVKIIRRIKYKHNAQGFFEGKWTHLFSIASEGGEVKQLTDGEFDVETAVQSPDGTQIAFVSNLENDADLSFFKNIYSISSTGGTPKLLWKGTGTIESLGWSPNGEHIAFSGRVIEDPGLVWYKNSDIWVLPIGGGEPKNLTANFDRSAQSEEVTAYPPSGILRWAPDSQSIYFRVDDHGSNHICKVSLDGTVEKVTEGKMTVGGFSLDKSGNCIAFNATDLTSPAELWILNKESMQCVTGMNNGLVESLRLYQPEEFWFAASDGVQVQGWLVKPHDFKSGEIYPMVFQIHGGPWGAYGNKLTAAEHEFQVLANYGFVMVYTNPRASTGYGEAFAARVSGHWGERDYEDIMEAVDYVLKTYPYIDANRLGVAGGSYGGFMTNWIIGHTDRFNAAVSQRGISNWYSFHGVSDIGWMRLPTHELTWGKDPWDNLEVIMEKSPITYVKNIKTPLLIIHSEEDYRCPMEQAEQLFIALKKLNREVELVRFPNETHELSRSGKPKHRVERLRHIVRWFDNYL